MKVYCNGEFVDKATIEEVLEPGFLFGWGAFETLRAYNKKVLYLGMHLERLKKGVEFLGLEYPEGDFEKIINSLLEANDLRDAYVRITVFKKRKSTGVLVYAAEFNYYKEDFYTKGSKVIFAPLRRYSGDLLLRIKSISYLRSRLSWFHAQKLGKDEALFIDEKDVLQEGTRSNVFFVKNQEVFTPALKCGILDGVTRRAAIHVCKQLGFKIHEGVFTGGDLLDADEVFLTSSLMEVMPVCEIENIPFKNSGYILTPAILKKYRQNIDKET